MTKRSLLPLFIHPSDLAVQTEFRSPLPLVVGNRDYAQREAQLRRMDAMLISSGIEADFLSRAVKHRWPGT